MRFLEVHGIRAIALSFDGLPVCGGGDEDLEAMSALAENMLKAMEREARPLNGIDGVDYVTVGGKDFVLVAVKLRKLVASILVGRSESPYIIGALSRLGSGPKCPRCGIDLSLAVTKCPRCKTSIPFLAPVCPRCKSPVIVKKCPYCGAKVDISGRRRII